MEPEETDDIVMIGPGSGSDTGNGALGVRRAPAIVRHRLLRSLALFLVPLLLLSWGLKTSAEAARLRRLLNQIHPLAAASEQRRRQLQTLEQRRRDLQRAVQATRRLENNAHPVSSLLTDLERGISKSPGVWLTRVRLDPARLLIEGRSRQAAAPARLLTHLNPSSFCAPLQLSRSSWRESAGAWTFELVGSIGRCDEE